MWQGGEEEPHTWGLGMPDGTSPLQESPGTKSALCWRNGPPCEAICHGVMPPIPLQKKRLLNRQGGGGAGGSKTDKEACLGRLLGPLPARECRWGAQDS